MAALLVQARAVNRRTWDREAASLVLNLFGPLYLLPEAATLILRSGKLVSASIGTIETQILFL